LMLGNACEVPGGLRPENPETCNQSEIERE
jgi:hypothetical protein